LSQNNLVQFSAGDCSLGPLVDDVDVLDLDLALDEEAGLVVLD
jgi:hypothetical protein